MLKLEQVVMENPLPEWDRQELSTPVGGYIRANSLDFENARFGSLITAAGT
jgi:hypothetical protein